MSTDLKKILDIINHQVAPTKLKKQEVSQYLMNRITPVCLHEDINKILDDTTNRNFSIEGKFCEHT